MAQSTEPTDIPMPQMTIEKATEVLMQGAAMLQWQRQEIERLKDENTVLRNSNERLAAELEDRDTSIRRLRCQLVNRIAMREPA